MCLEGQSDDQPVDVPTAGAVTPGPAGTAEAQLRRPPEWAWRVSNPRLPACKSRQASGRVRERPGNPGIPRVLPVTSTRFRRSLAPPLAPPGRPVPAVRNR